MEINRQIFAASLIQVPETEEALQREEDTLKAIPQRIVDEGFDAVNELLSIDRLGIAVYNETTHQLEYASNSIENELSSAGDNGSSATEDELWKEVVQRCFEQHTQLSAPGFEALPLVVDAAGDSRCVGVLYLEQQESVDQGDGSFIVGIDCAVYSDCGLQCCCETGNKIPRHRSSA